MNINEPTPRATEPEHIAAAKLQAGSQSLAKGAYNSNTGAEAGTAPEPKEGWKKPPLKPLKPLADEEERKKELACRSFHHCPVNLSTLVGHPEVKMKCSPPKQGMRKEPNAQNACSDLA